MVSPNRITHDNPELRMRPRGADPCQAPAPRDGPRRRRCAGGRAGRRRANGRPSSTARAARPMTGHRAEPVADVPPGVGLVWEDTRRPSTMKHIGEHICGHGTARRHVGLAAVFRDAGADLPSKVDKELSRSRSLPIDSVRVI